MRQEWRVACNRRIEGIQSDAAFPAGTESVDTTWRCKHIRRLVIHTISGEGFRQDFCVVMEVPH